MTETTGWVSAGVIIAAALAQTVRNMAQRSLTAEAGPLGAALARFLHGLPFSAGAVLIVGGLHLPLSAFTNTYAAWLATGALAQAAATSLLLLAMERTSYVVAVTYSKTEIIQVALLGTIILAESPTWLAAGGMAFALAGVFHLAGARHARSSSTRASGSAVWFGLGAGTGFALAAVAYRIAGLELGRHGLTPWESAAWSVLLAQLLQSVCIAGCLMVWQRRSLVVVLTAWRASLTAGFMGASASVLWFTAYTLRPAAEVRALGLVEVVFGYAISHLMLRQRLNSRERNGLLMVVAGAAAAALAPG
jgi:drug/metabolite transporter (DMT)-like permease